MGYVFYQRHIQDILLNSAQNTAAEISYIRDQYIQRHNFDFLNDFNDAFGRKYTIQQGVKDISKCRTNSYLIGQYTEFLKTYEPNVLVCESDHEVEKYQIFIPFPKEKELILYAYRKDFLSGKWHFLPVWSIGSALVLAFIAAVFLRNQMRPIIRLSKALQAFGRREQEIAYHPSGAIEIRKAGIEFLRMRQRLKEHINSRTMLLAGVSHDLRTILTRLKLELSLLPASEEVDNLKSDVKQMQAILDSYFDFIRDVETEELETLDITHELQKLVDRYKKHDLEIILSSDIENPVTIYKQSFMRCVMNLLSNAQRYGTLIHMGIRILENKNGKFIEFTIEDNGKGAAPENYEKIFEPFFSDNQSRTLSDNHGAQLGLGLSIVRNIARTKGGGVMASYSEALGGLRLELIFAL